MARINLGSIETVVVTVRDTSGVEDDLSGNTPEYRIYNDAGSPVIAWTTATASGMKINCEIDTVTDITTAGDYKLYARFTVSGDTPVLGPYPIKVVAL